MLQAPLSPLTSPLRAGFLAPDYGPERSLDEELLSSEISYPRTQHSNPLLESVPSFPCPTYVNRENISLFIHLRRKHKRKVHKLIKKKFQNTCEIHGILHFQMSDNSKDSYSTTPSTPLEKSKDLHEVLRRLNLGETCEMI